MPEEINPNYYQGYYPYGQQPDSQDLSLVEQTNPKDILREIELTLRGYRYDSIREEWVPPTGLCSPIVNEMGLNSLMADAKSVINQNTILSNLNKEEISKIIIRLGRSVKNKIKMNWKEFAVDKSNLDTSVFAVTDPAFTALKRAMGEGEKRFLKTSVRAIESYTSMAKPPQGSETTDKLKFWRQ